MIELYGYKTMLQKRTFDTYNDIDCFHYSDLHDYIKYLKWGYGKATDHACREIRLKRLTREQGIALVKQYSNVQPSREGLSLFLDWIGMSEGELYSYIDARRDPAIWRKGEDNKWELLDTVENHAEDSGIEDARLKRIEDCRFIVRPLDRPSDKEDKYVLIGRGWSD